MRTWKLIGDEHTGDFSLFRVQVEIDESLCLQTAAKSPLQCKMSDANELAFQEIELVVATDIQEYD